MLNSATKIHFHTESFESALRVALREDPNIVLVGEMRDIQTVRLALTAAETGHLVFATLHTSSAAKSIHRIIDVFLRAKRDGALNAFGVTSSNRFSDFVA